MKNIIHSIEDMLNGIRNKSLHLKPDQCPIDHLIKDCIISDRRSQIDIPINILQDFAILSNDVYKCQIIQDRIWLIIKERAAYPHIIRKVLVLLEYLILNGNENIYLNCQETSKKKILELLAEEYNKNEFERFNYSRNSDIGAGVRKQAKNINNLLLDNIKLEEKRKTEKELKEKFKSMGLRR